MPPTQKADDARLFSCIIISPKISLGSKTIGVAQSHTTNVPVMHGKNCTRL